MLRAIDSFRPQFAALGITITTPKVVQVLSEDELIELVPLFDGWIIGDDPATARVFKAGVAGKLKAAVKWGVGVDNVDFEACRRLNLPISNTPGMFGREVADVALGYVIALARQTFQIDVAVKAGGWIKPAGMSLAGKQVALVGFGDIGRNVARRLVAADMHVIAYDPYFKPDEKLPEVEQGTWPERLNEVEFIVLTCALTVENRHMLAADAFSRCKSGVRVVNVARGPLIDENALADALETGVVHSAALEVFEEEPLADNSDLRVYGDRCLFGSHNSSNTVDAVQRTSYKAVDLMANFLKIAPPTKPL